MININIQLDILNADDIVRKEKGAFVGAMANIFMSREKLKRKVEEVVRLEIEKALQENILFALQEKGVVADLKVNSTIEEVK